MPPSTRMVVNGLTGRSPRMAASISAAACRVGTRTSTLARTSGATTLDRSPPSMVPTLTVMPRAASLRANSLCTWWDISRMALAPSSGLTPAWAARPWTVMVKLPDALRAVFSFPARPKAGSRMKARTARLASRRMSGVESGLPISSSELMTTTLSAAGRSPSSFTARSACSICTRPPFMSKTPGPRRVSPSTRTGMSRRVPTGQTVSQWPTSS